MAMLQTATHAHSLFNSSVLCAYQVHRDHCHIEGQDTASVDSHWGYIERVSACKRLAHSSLRVDLGGGG